MSQADPDNLEITVRDQQYELNHARREIAELKKSNRATTWTAFALFLLFMWASSGDSRVRNDVEDKLSTILDKWENGAPVDEVKKELNALDDDLQPEPESDDPY